MNERRITVSSFPNQEKEFHNLKQVAGLLTKLPYRDMQRLVKAVDPTASTTENVELIEMLLTGAETILKEPVNGH